LQTEALKGPSTSVDATLHATVPKIVIGTKILYRLNVAGINQYILPTKVYIGLLRSTYPVNQICWPFYWL